MRTSILLLSVLACLAACGPKLPEPGPLPPGQHFAGIWDSNWGQMKLRDGPDGKIFGSLKGFRSGSLSGTTEGDLLLFTWHQMESRQWGRGYLRMSPDGGRLEGRWGYQKDMVSGGRWWATRAQDQGD